jgi:hypothetical protein
MRTLLSATALVFLTLGAPAAAARKPITGELSQPRYTVIALTAQGKARVVRATRGRFALRPPARSVTLQLRSPRGIYAGPVVVGRQRRGKRAILGVRPGARLGRIRVRRGYARVARRVRKRRIDAGLWARARRGVPIGVGRFGRVRSRRPREAPPADIDADGIPDLLDVDDDGDRVLDGLDRSPQGAAAGAAQDEERFDFHTRLNLPINQTANANAAGLTPAQMDAALASAGDLLLNVLPGDASPNSPELDCGGSIQQPPRPEGLEYCRPHAAGGIGTIGYPPMGAPPPFPDCCDADGDGLGKMTADAGPLGQPLTGMTLHHHATTAQIGTGDVMIQRVKRGGVETSFLGALQYVFASVPAVVSYARETGPAVTVPYPYTAATDPDGPGPIPSRPEPFAVADGPDPDSDVEVELTFWRPQRAAVPEWGETGDWIDIGRLRYSVEMEFSGLECPQGAFSESDPDLALNNARGIPEEFGPGFTDTDGDHPASRANTFTFGLNLTRCLASNGFTFDPGQERSFNIRANNWSGVDNAQQAIWFRRQ